MAQRSNTSKTFVWIILGLLILGLAGFGATNFTGSVRTVGYAGDQEISVNAYARELQAEMRTVEAETGQPLTIDQAIALGLDSLALSRLVALASLDNEAAEMGLSIGDRNLQREIVRMRSFQGLNGDFDREAYSFALEQAGISEAEFEEDLRAEVARTLLQNAIVAGVSMPAPMTKTLIGFLGSRRSFTWAQLTADDLAEPLADPEEAALRAYYDQNNDLFTLPETKRLTYALLTPEMLLDGIEVDEDALRSLYAERSDIYDQPERRLVERLAFLDQAAAESAMAQLEVSGTTFEVLVQGRGLALEDIDLGDVTAEELGEAGEAVFAAEVGDVVGPLPSDLGPALFRVNGVLAARTTSFDEARAELRDELAGDRARRMIESQSEDIDDLLAGGATLEELAEETDMGLGRVDWTPVSRDGVLAYPAFREAAAAVSAEDFPEVTFLDDGGIFALRLEEELPERPQPFDSALPRVEESWRVQAIEAALTAQATEAIATLGTGAAFDTVGLSSRTETGLTRTAFVEGTPPGFMAEVFSMKVGDVAMVPGGGTVAVVRLDEELPPEEGGDLDRLRSVIDAEFDQALANALFQAFAADAQNRAKPVVDQRAVDAVAAGFR